MHKISFFVVAVTFVLSLFTSSFAAMPEIISPIGYWKTVDKVSGKPKSIVQIWQAPDKVLMGKVIKVFSDKKINQTVCSACKGSKHDQPILGMVIMSGLKSGNVQWKHGEILNPENGKTYHCTVRLTENGKKLNVHGYVGLPLFGRSQTWERVDLMSG